MCGRYTRFAATELIYQHFGIKAQRPEPASSELAPSWNVTPQTMQPVIRQSPETGEREMVLMRWGLVPFYAETPVFNYSTINARADPLRPPIDLLRPYDAELMKTWRVKPDVGNVRNNRPDLIEPFDPEEPPTLF